MTSIESRFPPEVTAPGMQITIRHQLAATVVSIEGVAGGETPDADLDHALPLLPPGTQAVVVDLTDLTLLDREVVRRLLNRLKAMLVSSGGSLVVVCRRSTARALLRAWNLHERVALYPSIDAALN